MNHRLFINLAAICIILLLGGCNTYDTLDSQRATGSLADETNRHYGQPYYLPKTMLRLQIAKTSGGGSGNTSASSMTNTNSATGAAVTVYTQERKVEVAPDAPGFPNPLAPGGPQPGQFPTPAEKPKPPPKIAYAITVTSETVPDHQTGALYVHYNQNWFYSEEVKIAVNNKDLLTTSETTSSDRTAQAIYNLVDTAANVFKFSEAGFNPFSAADPSKAIPKGTGRKVLYKDVSVDFRFDPFDERDLRKLADLFTDDTTAEAYYVSPFFVRITTPQSGGVPKSPKKPAGRRGLYFREPVPVQIEIVGRESRYLSVIQYAKKHATEATFQLLQAQEEATRGAVEHRAERLTFAAHNKERVFAYNVARSAFVSDKKQTLTIVDGSLRGVHLVKPSEAQGFTEIPLTLTQKLLDLPKSLLSLRHEITTKQGEIVKAKGNEVNEQTNLNNAVANQALAQETARLQAEKARLQAELDLLKLKKEESPVME